jgi:hypothetical protein
LPTSGPDYASSKQFQPLFFHNTGGWAGGEAGLWQLREQVMREKAAAKSATKAAAAAATAAAARAASPPAPKDGKQPIYVGYAKE